MNGRMEDYETLEIIGTGSYGTCYKIRNKVSGRLYVWKAIDYGQMSEDKKQLLVSEVNLLSELRHPHIVRFYDRIIHKDTTTLYIIMEWCQGGDLASLIQQHKSKGQCLDEVFVWRVLYQTGRALQACHSHLRDVTVLHRDIKPANVFLDNQGNVKLGDFGLARILHGQNTCSDTIVGTPLYMSPEITKGDIYDHKSDIWALGCLVYELCTLSPPFVGRDIRQLLTSIQVGKFDPIPSNFSEDLQKIIELMLSVEHQYRPTIEMILHHPTVVMNISTIKSSFKFSGKKHCSTDIVCQKIKLLSVIKREPEENSEATFKEKWRTKLESLKQREANVSAIEEKLLNKERSLLKREKHLMLIERMAKEKLYRVEVYLRQCKENRLPQPSGGLKPHKYKTVEELDTSLSADPGDTSILPTSAKIEPELIVLPKTLVRLTSEKRPKHVHFQMNKQAPSLPNIHKTLKKCLSETQNVEMTVINKPVLNMSTGDIQQIEQTRLLRASSNKLVNASEHSTVLKPLPYNNVNWIEIRNAWVENKKLAYHGMVCKENEDTKYSSKESKGRSSNTSLFSNKQGIR